MLRSIRIQPLTREHGPTDFYHPPRAQYVQRTKAVTYQFGGRSSFVARPPVFMLSISAGAQLRLAPVRPGVQSGRFPQEMARTVDPSGTMRAESGVRRSILFQKVALWYRPAIQLCHMLTSARWPFLTPPWNCRRGNGKRISNRPAEVTWNYSNESARCLTPARGRPTTWHRPRPWLLLLPPVRSPATGSDPTSCFN
jgi:hypothetical protein